MSLNNFCLISHRFGINGKSEWFYVKLSCGFEVILLNICCWTSLGRGRGCRFLWAAVAADPVGSALSLHRALQLQQVQLQRVQLPGLDAPSSGKTSVLQPWREYGYSLQWENHTPSCGKTTVLRFSHRRDATTYNGRRK